MILGAWGVVLGVKADARSNLDPLWVQVVRKVLKLMPKWSPRGALGSTLDL
jgi:hypothetical protein